MALAEDPAIRTFDLDRYRAAIFKPETQRNPDPFGGVPSRIEVNRPLNPVQAGNG